VTKCDGGRGEIFAQNSVTSFMDGPLLQLSDAFNKSLFISHYATLLYLGRGDIEANEALASVKFL